MRKKRLNQKGLVGTAIFLLLLGVAAVILGLLIFEKHHNKVVSTSQNSSSTQPQTESISPQSFVSTMLASIATNDETKFETYLSTDFKSFRQSNLAKAPCNGNVSNINSSGSVLAVFCGSLLNPSDISHLTPTVSDFTFKDGKKGKSVDYQKVKTTGDAGTTYYTFKLLPLDGSWQLHDYADIFVQSNSSLPRPFLGMREQ